MLCAALFIAAWLISPCVGLNVEEVSADGLAFFDEESQECSVGDGKSCALSLLQHKAVAKKRRAGVSHKQGSQQNKNDPPPGIFSDSFDLSTLVLGTCAGAVIGILVGRFASWPWIGLLAGATTGALVGLAASLPPADYTYKGDGFEAIVNDPLYISLLQKVPVLSVDGQTLLNGTENLYESIFPATDRPFPIYGLFLWGSEKADGLFIFIPGTHSNCTQYAATLATVAGKGYFVVCPQMSLFSRQAESVMKPVCAVEWATTRSNYSSIVIGGHSGGAQATPAAAKQLISRGFNVQAIVLAHPGQVPFLNVAGCAKYVEANMNMSSTEAQFWFETCRQYFPDDLYSFVSLKVLVIDGNFCEWSSALNSNWYNGSACTTSFTYSNESCYMNSTNYTSPNMPPVICPTDLCPNVAFLRNPGDCMEETYNASSGFVNAVLKEESNEVAHLQTCSDHGYGMVGPNGAKEEGALIAEYVQQLRSTREVRQQWLQSLSESRRTCHSWKNTNESCLFVVSPYSTELVTQYYMGDNYSRSYLCSEAPEMTVDGATRVFYRGEARQ